MSHIAKRMYNIVCTGGPCGGKSTALGAISSMFTESGMDSYIIPEMPTMIKAAGFPYPGPAGGDLLKEFEFTLFDLQRTFEDRCRALALERERTRHKPVVFVMDRGLIDIKAYMPNDVWLNTIHRAGMTEEQVYARYDLALHLMTAADGATSFYTRANNIARTETIEEALFLDNMIKNVYQPLKPNWFVIPNPPGGFAEKLHMAKQMAFDFVMRQMEHEGYKMPPVPGGC